jgi:hypothetical protein
MVFGCLNGRLMWEKSFESLLFDLKNRPLSILHDFLKYLEKIIIKSYAKLPFFFFGNLKQLIYICISTAITNNFFH